MPPYRTQIIENSHAERDDRGDVELHPQLVPEVGQPRRQGRIREEAAEEHSRLERARDVRLERSENGVERREQRDRRVAGIGDRDREWRHEAEQHPQEREQDRDDNYLHAGAPGDGEGSGAPGDGDGVAGCRDQYPAAGSEGFITLTYMRSTEL